MNYMLPFIGSIHCAVQARLSTIVAVLKRRPMVAKCAHIANRYINQNCYNRIKNVYNKVVSWTHLSQPSWRFDWQPVLEECPENILKVVQHSQQL